jgi:hypothetical protein
VGVVVGEGPQSVEFFLASSIPEGQFDVDIVDEDVWPSIRLPAFQHISETDVGSRVAHTMNIVLEDRRLIDCWEVPGTSSAADPTG